MEGSDNEWEMNDDDDDHQVVDEKKHERLINNILKLNKPKKPQKQTSRTEPTIHMSEFDLVTSVAGDKANVKISDLLKAPRDRKTRLNFIDKVKKGAKVATLPKPLEKPQTQRIRRGIAYEKAKLALDRWEPIVTANRASINLNFPLEQQNKRKVEAKEAEKFPSMWRIKSKLAQKLEQIEKEEQPKSEEYIIGLEDEVNDGNKMTMKDMLEKRRESAKLRAHQSYQEAKARRQGKIKSKKFHRIQKRERIKQKLKEFEELQKTNPEEALERLDEIERARVEERFSLRHKSTGKWARNKQIRAKYDKESRQVLAQQLAISKELTQKQKQYNSDSDEEQNKFTSQKENGLEKDMGAQTAHNIDGDSDEEQYVSSQNENGFGKGTETKSAQKVDESNIWEAGIKPTKEVTDFVDRFHKFVSENNKQKEQPKEAPQTELASEQVEIEESQLPQKKTKRKNKSTSNVEEQEVTHQSSARVDSEEEQQKPQKKVKRKKALSTTQWDVSIPYEEEIDEMFSKLENKLKKKKLKGIKRLQRNLGVTTVQEKKKKDTERKKIDLTLPTQARHAIIDEPLIEVSGSHQEVVEDSNAEELRNILKVDEKKDVEAKIDPNINKKKVTKLRTAIPDVMTLGEGSDEEVNRQTEDIDVALEDDEELAEEFNKEKKDEIEKDTPKPVVTVMPGWGSWAGPNMKPKPKRKPFRFTKKIVRKDDNNATLIINEKVNMKGIKDHLVSDVPFPFKSVKDFEASLRAPITREFVTETAFRRYIKPAVTTKMGVIIEPMSKDVLLNKKSS